MHAQSCLTLCDPLDWSPPGSSVHGIHQARILEWASISYSRGSSQPRDWTCTSCISRIGRQFLYHQCRFPVYLSPPSLRILCPVKVLFLIPFESAKGRFSYIKVCKIRTNQLWECCFPKQNCMLLDLRALWYMNAQRLFCLFPDFQPYSAEMLLCSYLSCGWGTLVMGHYIRKLSSHSKYSLRKAWKATYVVSAWEC